MAALFGEIILKDTADQEFGSVISSASMESEQIRKIAQDTNDLIMFYITESEIYILGDNRSVLYPLNSEFDTETICKVYSKTKFNELLDRGQNSITNIELRENTLTVTNGNYTLEYGSNCPPFCTNQ